MLRVHAKLIGRPLRLINDNMSRYSQSAHDGDYDGKGFSLSDISLPKKLGIGCLGLLVVWLIVGLAVGGGNSDVKTATVRMDMDDCAATIKRTANELGVEPVSIVETGALKMARFPTTDGSVIVTCSADGGMAVTKSPYNAR
ncbi:hypothetical protein LZ518_08515 [Sphingomonas sp. RB56-2]|uniref:Uncharacterized protein n=1 Tax=Sphingomonas brevis TaxID=2908206 RepID=A0ABT0SAI4_9SPHN|nr:hypothetical protein [Sphingomonas brevis]MCL6741172.1 hypothetical protein [Sphingomonas brevis]